MVRVVAQKKSDSTQTVAVLTVPISWPSEPLSDALVLFVIIGMALAMSVTFSALALAVTFSALALIVILGLPINEINGLFIGTCTLSLHKLCMNSYYFLS